MQVTTVATTGKWIMHLTIQRPPSPNMQKGVTSYSLDTVVKLVFAAVSDVFTFCWQQI